MRSGATMSSFVMTVLGTVLSMALEPMLQPEDEELSKEACTAEKLMPLEARTKPMVILEGDRRGERIELEMSRDEGDHWLLELGDLHTMSLSKDAEGDIVLHRLKLPSENYEVIYDEPVTLLPAECRADEAIAERTTAKVIDLESGESIGTAEVEHEVSAVSIARLDLPAGAMRVFLIESDQRLELDNADVTIRLETAYHPQRGEVYRRHKTTIQKLGIFGETHTSATALSEGASAASG